MYKKLTLVLIAALIIVLFRQNETTGTAQPDPIYPGNPPGFEPATTISDADAFECANQFKSVYGKGSSIVSGGVITREAFDAILSTKDCNAISYKFCTDPSGRIAPANTIFVVFSGANVASANNQTMVTEINANKYTSKQWCPPACMKFMIRDASGNLVPQE